MRTVALLRTEPTKERRDDAQRMDALRSLRESLRARLSATRHSRRNAAKKAARERSSGLSLQEVALELDNEPVGRADRASGHREESHRLRDLRPAREIMRRRVVQTRKNRREAARNGAKARIKELFQRAR